MITDWEVLTDWAEKFTVKLSSDKLNQFQTYHKLLLDWNQKINLISRQDIGRIVSYHFIDSISVIPELPHNSIVCDLGTGAGLPGIPIKILRDDIILYLVESIKKKSYFLAEAIKTLDLKNTILLPRRAETIKDIKFDIVLVRLFGKIFDVLPLASQLLKNNGKVIFYKIHGVEKEIAGTTNVAIKTKMKLIEVKDVILPLTGIVRKLVIYQSLSQ